MRRSKLELYIDTLKILAQRGPMRLTHIMGKANFNAVLLKANLNYLIEAGLVEQRIISMRRGNPVAVFANTPKGNIVLKLFSEFRQMLPMEEEESLNPRVAGELMYEDIILNRYKY
jgi:predicted transcriptional regulator